MTQDDARRDLEDAIIAYGQAKWMHGIHAADGVTEQEAIASKAVYKMWERVQDRIDALEAVS